MFVTNNTNFVKYFFYKVAGMSKTVKFGPNEGMELVDLESTDQITYNAHDFKLKGINERFGRNFQTTLKSESYLKLTFTDIGTFLSDYYFNWGTDITDVNYINSQLQVGSPVQSCRIQGNSIFFIGGNFDFDTTTILNPDLLVSYHNYGSCRIISSFTNFINLVEVRTTVGNLIIPDLCMGCTSLITFSAPNATGNLFGNAFKDCTSLVSLTIPEITFINSVSNFENCTSLSSISLPKITQIQLTNNFAGCSSLTSISLPLLTSISSTGTFKNCTSLQSVDFPLCTTIRNNTFENCTSLQTVYIPSCSALGTSVANNSVFLGVTGKTITLTIKASRMTANAGAPDGDIAYLQANNTVTVVQT